MLTPAAIPWPPNMHRAAVTRHDHASSRHRLERNIVAVSHRHVPARTRREPLEVLPAEVFADARRSRRRHRASSGPARISWTACTSTQADGSLIDTVVRHALLLFVTLATTWLCSVLAGSFVAVRLRGPRLRRWRGQSMASPDALRSRGRRTAPGAVGRSGSRCNRS